MLVNALIREYLEYNGYALTQTVMEHEAPTAAVDRRQMEAALGVATESSDVANFPLLYSLVFQHVATERPLALHGPTTANDDAPAANEKTAANGRVQRPAL
ncbi:hypothetical protein AMAG_20107 [Allomyces macrogynus ATCC 38327]|uniref:FGFR1 oncogene partner (FOP) N-terminal dimerisation domain-containing protein n=1 Tax=Allomyces macrogynus (strain ATCC 38327) TaxID=578462 RepID=A0A0L0T6H9_ALLM3|nr:hypothetical protein AMAG_20107 [Allomyces macrogynus ATCC 38327]|eukprot:KNE70408.1 hypothetical protein AMAG_20107 [Allomyces macrogynus ATCC 38327]